LTTGEGAFWDGRFDVAVKEERSEEKFNLNSMCYDCTNKSVRLSGVNSGEEKRGLPKS